MTEFPGGMVYGFGPQETPSVGELADRAYKEGVALRLHTLQLAIAARDNEVATVDNDGIVATAQAFHNYLTEDRSAMITVAEANAAAQQASLAYDSYVDALHEALGRPSEHEALPEVMLSTVAKLHAGMTTDAQALAAIRDAMAARQPLSIRYHGVQRILAALDGKAEPEPLPEARDDRAGEV